MKPSTPDDYKPGDMYNSYKKRASKKRGLRPASVVVADEQKSSHQMYKKNKNWIAGAIKKPGSLRAALGVKGDKNIPPKKLAAAAKKGGKIGKRAQLAETLKSFHKAKPMKVACKKHNKVMCKMCG